MNGRRFKEHLLYLAEGDGSGGQGGSSGSASPPAVQEWFTGLPDTLKPDAAVFEPFKDKPVTDVLGAYRDLSKKAADYTVPATPKEYGITLPKDAPVDAKALEVFLSKAHKAGVPAKALQALINDQVTEAIASEAEDKKAVDAADKALRESWGANYEANRVAVEREIKALPQTMQDIITKSGLGNHPHLFELIHLVASARGEGKLRAGGDEGAKGKSDGELFYGGTA
jgi:hypothetical protein